MNKVQFPKRIVSGMRPTGRLHLGHYFGVLVNYLELQNSADCFYMVADLHALTTGDLSQATVGENSRQLLIDWLSVGIDPEKATIFVQSAVPEHSELHVLLSMVTSLGWLERNPTYKEQVTELGEKNTGSLGFLSYPVLQTVDVCIYKGTLVPVGADQTPHLEMGRELIRRFNTTFKKQVFPEFLPLLTPTPKVPGIDGRKMSKSYGNSIELAEDPDKVRVKVNRMLTDVERPRREDPGHPEKCNLFAFHELFTPTAPRDQIARDCRAALLSCGEDKKLLADRIIAWQEPIRKRRAELEKEPSYIDEIVKKGVGKAREIASQTLAEAREVMKLWPPRGLT